MPLVARCACAGMGRTAHHPMCPLWRPAPVAPKEQEPDEVAPAPVPEEVEEMETPPSPPNDSEESTMARRASVKAEPATAREVREFLLAQDAEGKLPEGVTVGTRGRLSEAAKAHYSKVTKREIAA